MKYGSLFAGIEGFGYGARRAGLKHAYSVELNKKCQNVIRRHFPKSPIYGDIRDVGVGRKFQLPWVDIIFGGWPCQDLSTAGRRTGFNGDRSVLFFELLRIVYEQQPLVCQWENVPGLLTSCSCKACGKKCAKCNAIAGEEECCLVCGSNEVRGRLLPAHKGADFFAVVSAFNVIGYSGAWTLFDSQNFGLAQRRERIFGCFVRADIGAECASEILAFPSRLSRYPHSRRSPRQKVAGTITHSARKSSVHGGNTGLTLIASGSRDAADGERLVSGALTSKMAKGTGGPAGDECQNLIAATMHSAHCPTDGSGIVAQRVTPPLNAQMGKSRANDFETSGGLVADTLRCHPRPGSDTLGACTIAPVDLAQITNKDNRASVKPGAPATTLAATGRAGVVVAPTIDTKSTRMGGVVGQATIVVKTDNTTSNGCGVLEDGTTHTLGGSQDAVMREEGIRRFTPTECERLQGFPDQWTEWGIDCDGNKVLQSDTTRYEQLGNAVSTTVAEFISKRIKRALRNLKP